MSAVKKFPHKTIPRALLYIRTLEDLKENGQEFISSKELARITGLTDVQIRKDISNFASVGKPRIGYEIAALKKVLEEFVQKATVHVALFGVGNLGKAILRYPEFQSAKIQLVVAFDKNPKMIGKTIRGVQVYSSEEARVMIPKSHAEIGIIATPKQYAQQIADVMVICGMKGIMNFAPTSVVVPPQVLVRNFDMSIEFLSLFCDIQNQ